MGFLRKATIIASGGGARLVIKPNSKKERTANATEKQLKLQAQAMRQDRERQAAAKRQAEIDAGAWWLEPRAFKNVSSLLLKARYLGGWPTNPAPQDPQNRNLRFDQSGLHLKGALRTVLTLPWPEVLALEVEDMDKAASRPAVQAILTSEPDGSPGQQGVLVVTSRSGEEAVFLVDRVPAVYVRTKLSPLGTRITQGRASALALQAPGRSSTVTESVANPAPVTSLADEIAKLGSLRASGLLTEDEFTALKAKLLD